MKIGERQSQTGRDDVLDGLSWFGGEGRPGRKPFRLVLGGFWGMQPDRVVAARLLIPEPTERSKLLREKSLRGLIGKKLARPDGTKRVVSRTELSQEEACLR